MRDEKPRCGAPLIFGPVTVHCLIPAGHRAIIHMSKAVLEDGREVSLSWRVDDKHPVTPLVTMKDFEPLDLTA